jgi:hypothetical protein
MSDEQQELNEAEDMILQLRENCRIQTERADAAEKEIKRLTTEIPIQALITLPSGLDAPVENYRPTMTEDVLHFWAKDAQAELEKSRELLRQFTEIFDKGNALGHQKAAKIESLTEEIQRLQGLMSEALHIEKLHYENGKLELSGTHPLGEAVIAALVSVFVSSFSENYLEMQVYHPDVGPLAVILQRIEGKTPAQVASELRAVVREADEYLDTNSLTNIGHGSILHQKFKALLPKKVE